MLDKSLVLNAGGAAASSGNSGIYFEEDGDNASSFIRVGSDRLTVQMKPAAGNLITLNQSLRTTDTPTFATVTSNGNLVVAGGGAVVYSNQNNTRKRVVIYERGDPLSNSDHRFDGFGKIASEMVYQVGGGEHVFYYATSATSSIEMMRIAWNYVSVPSALNVAGNINLPSVSSNINFSNLTSSRKRIVLYERGVATDPNDHRFDGIGKIASEMVFQVGNGDYVFYYATSATTSNELMRIAGTGVITIPTVISNTNNSAKQFVCYDAGVAATTTAHNFNGLGSGSLMMRYQVNAASNDHVFFCATSATASNELMRIKGNGAVSIPGTLTVNGASTLVGGTTVMGAMSVQYAISSGSVTTTGNVGCATLTATGNASCASLTSAGNLSCGTFTANGLGIFSNGASVQGALHVQANVNCASVAATGSVSCATLTVTGATTFSSIDSPSVITNNIVFPLGTLSHYEEATYDSTWTGPTTTGVIRLLITRIGRVVTASMARVAGIGLTTTTPGQLDWTMTTTIQGKFAPIGETPPGMTFIIPIANNGTGQSGLLSVNGSTNTIKISPMNNAVWTGSIGWTPWSVSWTTMPYVP